MDNALFLVVAAGAVVLWLLYHKLFHVTYFGGAFRTILNELVCCFVISTALVALIANVGAKLLTAVVRLLAFLFRGALIVGGICLAVWLLWKLIKAFRRGPETETVSPADDGAETAPQQDVSSAEAASGSAPADGDAGQ